MWAPGVHDGSSPPSGSANVNATTSGLSCSRLVITAVWVRPTGTTRDGFHRLAEENPLSTVARPQIAV